MLFNDYRKGWMDTWWAIPVVVVLGTIGVAVFEYLRFKLGWGPLG